MLIKYLKIIFLFILLVFSGLFTPTPTWAQSEGEGEDEALEQRIESDQEQTKLEAEELSQLQEQDYEQCVAEANGSSPEQSDPGEGSPDGDSTPTEPGSGWNEEDEEKVRAELEAAGVTVNKEPCRGRDYHDVKGGCTDVAGLPRKTIDRLKETSAQTGPFVLGGGTEPGHSTHGIGNNVVDVRPNNSFNNWVRDHAVGQPVQESHGLTYLLDNGDQITREDMGGSNDHWHWSIKGNGSSVALQNKAVKYAQIFIDQLKSWFLPSARAANANNQIIIGDRLIDVETVSGPELETLFLDLSPSELNNIFSNTSLSNVRTITNKLPFNGINHTISNLSPDNLNRVVGSLGQNDLGRMINNLTSGGDTPGSFGSLDSLFNQLSGGSLNSLINSLDNNALNTAFSALNQGSLDEIFNNLSGGMVNNLIGRLGQGSLNSIFNQISGGSLNQIVGNLGMTSLNNLFKQVSGFGLDNIFDNLSGNVLNSIFPSLSQSTLVNIFTTSAPDILNGALGQMAPDLVADIASRLPTDLVEDLADKIPELAKALPLAGITLPDPLGGLGAIITGGLYVPVVEQNGQLMQLTKSIDTTDKQIKDLSVQICTHLKAIRRIQSRFEQKMVEDADVDRVKATEIEKYRTALFDTIKKGGARIDENGEEVTDTALYVVNNREYIRNAGEEGAQIAIDKLAKNNNSNNLAVWEGLILENGLGRIGPNIVDIENVIGKTEESSEETLATNNKTWDRIPIISTLLKPVRNTLAWITGNRAFAAAEDQEEDIKVDSDQFWGSFMNLVASNPGLTYLRTIGDIEQSANREILAARDEALQGQGFKPTRTCINKTADGKDCEAWAIIQPGIMIKEAGSSALNSRLTQYENADSMGEVGQGNEPNVQEVLTMTPTPGGGGALGPGMVEPSNIPGQSEDGLRSEPGTNEIPSNGGDDQGGSGDTGGIDLPDFPDFPDFPDTSGDPNDPQNNSCQQGNPIITGIINILGKIFANNDSIGQGNLDPLLQVLTYLANNNCKDQAPFLYFGSKSRGNGVYNLYWFSPNATLLTGCKTKNNWVNGAEIIKPTGSTLNAPWGNLNVSTSTTETLTTYKIECSNNNGATTTTITI